MVRFWGFCSATDRLRQRMIGLLLMRSRRGRLFVRFGIRKSSGRCSGLRSLSWRGRSESKAFIAENAEKCRRERGENPFLFFPQSLVTVVTDTRSSTQIGFV